MPTKIKTHTYKGFTIASYENATGAKRWMIELNGKDYKPASNFTTLTNAKNYIDSHKLICLQDSGELTIAIEAQIMFLIIFQPHSLEIDGVIITPEPVLEYHATRSAADWELSRLQRMRSVKTVKLYEEL